MMVVSFHSLDPVSNTRWMGWDGMGRDGTGRDGTSSGNQTWDCKNNKPVPNPVSYGACFHHQEA